MAVCIFGEAERGAFATISPCHSVIDLFELAGNPPQESLGIFYAIQMLLFKRSILFFRVEEEGFNCEQYLKGLELLLLRKEPLSAVCMPGVGEGVLIEMAAELCNKRSALLLINEKDLYDYLTDVSISK